MTLKTPGSTALERLRPVVSSRQVRRDAPGSRRHREAPRRPLSAGRVMDGTGHGLGWSWPAAGPWPDRRKPRVADTESRRFTRPVIRGRAPAPARQQGPGAPSLCPPGQPGRAVAARSREGSGSCTFLFRGSCRVLRPPPPSAPAEQVSRGNPRSANPVLEVSVGQASQFLLPEPTVGPDTILRVRRRG